MKIVAHCFAPNASIKPTSFFFAYKKYQIKVFSIEQTLTLENTKIATSEELENLKRVHSENIDPAKLENKLLRYKHILTEAAQLLEGLFGIMYNSIPPKFKTNSINVNLYSETQEEQDLLDNDTIPRFFGNVDMPKIKPSYQIPDFFAELTAASVNHLPALSFFSQATRSLESNDNEIAFFLYFRIIDGYFSDGASAVENALLKKQEDLKKYILNEDELKKSTASILSELGLPSKSHVNYEGLISDIVLIRHKLTHFSTTNARTHHNSKVVFELFTVNSYLYQACFNLLRDKIYENNHPVSE